MMVADYKPDVIDLHQKSKNKPGGAKYRQPAAGMREFVMTGEIL
jgi:hypothetical protein